MLILRRVTGIRPQRPLHLIAQPRVRGTELGALVPDHGHVKGRDRDRWRQNLQPSGGVRGEARGDERDQIGLRHDLGHEQKMLGGEQYSTPAPGAFEDSVGDAPEPTAVG